MVGWSESGEKSKRGISLNRNQAGKFGCGLFRDVLGPSRLPKLSANGDDVLGDEVKDQIRQRFRIPRARGVRSNGSNVIVLRQPCPERALADAVQASHIGECRTGEHCGHCFGA